jgi:hypothetical protein
MNCVELQQSLAEIDDGSNAEQRAHLKTCRTCAALVADLNLIASSAIELRDAHEPSPRVWNSIEIALRQEGLVRPQTVGRSLLPSLTSHWGWSRWMLPAAAVVLLALGILLRPHTKSAQVADNLSEPTTTNISSAGLIDDDLLQEISEQSPALQQQYADNLRRVNQYIQDAKVNVDANPNDEEARRSLMDAYQEKAMLFELAMDRGQQ